MSHLEREVMARIQIEWQQAFASLLLAARRYAAAGAHSYAQGYQDFVQLSSAAIALYQVEEHYPLQPMMEVWPREGWERAIHEAAVAWAELSVFALRGSAEGEYATLSMERMRALQHSALEAPSGDTIHDFGRSAGETRHDV